VARALEDAWPLIENDASICAARHGSWFEIGASGRRASLRSRSEALGVAFWNGTVRSRLQASVEGLIGRPATVTSACLPHGLVLVDGEIWEARCAEGADRGERVAVVSRDLLWLVVERLDRERPMHRRAKQVGANRVRRWRADPAFGGSA
jgi:NfeD-like C-terminal, partner-binding